MVISSSPEESPPPIDPRKPDDMPSREEFTRWLRQLMEEQGWTEAELARRSRMTQSQIGRVMTGERNAGLEFYRGMARAFRLPLEEVLRAAGVLPPVTGRDQTTAQLLGQLDSLSPSVRAAVLRAWGSAVDLATAVAAEVDQMRRLNRLLDNLPPGQYEAALQLLREALAREGKAGEAPSENPPDQPETDA